MKLLFLASALEPGRDGVGDYTVLLAEACARLGHRCAVAALSDGFVEKPVAAEGKLRLPAALSREERMRLFRPWRENFGPDWISLQLVPYAFHPKGILTAEAIEFFREATVGTPLHLMLHELWLGAGRPSPLRHHLMGAFQKLGVKRLVRELHPRLITTSNPVYAAMLKSVGIVAQVLPLFGNVPILPTAELPALEQLLPGTGVTEKDRRDWWVGVFFGALPPEWKAEPFLSTLLRAAGRAGKRVCLVLAGRAGESGRATWRSLQRDYSTRLALAELGEQPAATISALLQKADFGIAGSPWQLIGKSGTAAAMLDHGLPVIVTRDDFQPVVQGEEPPSSHPLVHRLDEKLEAKLVAGLAKAKPQAAVDTVAEQLCARYSAMTKEGASAKALSTS